MFSKTALIREQGVEDMGGQGSMGKIVVGLADGAVAAEDEIGMASRRAAEVIMNPLKFR